jgi:hypothetical protein
MLGIATGIPVPDYNVGTETHHGQDKSWNLRH